MDQRYIGNNDKHQIILDSVGQFCTTSISLINYYELESLNDEYWLLASHFNTLLKETQHRIISFVKEALNKPKPTLAHRTQLK